MVKVRQDAWSHEDDLLLAETVLRHIREGSTQLNAFEEVGDKLNRTSAACGFRWNAEVRQRYDQAVAIAKRQRKEKKRALAKQQKANQQRQVTSQATSNSEFNTVSQPVQEDQLSHYDHQTVAPQMEASSMNLDSVIDYLRTLKKDFKDSNRSRNNLEKIQYENEELRKQNDSLEKELQKLQKQLNTVQEDYQVLIQIMDRARKMVVFDDDENVSNPAFRMEKNGNLEQVAR